LQYAKVEKKSTAKCDAESYSNYLLVVPHNRGCTRLAKAMQGLSHDSVNRFLEREEFEPGDLFERVKGYLQLRGGTLSVDDTVLDKPYSDPKKNELIGFHYSGKHHDVVPGICMVVLFYTDAKGVKLPVNWRIYHSTLGKTKNELFLEMLEEVLEWGLKPALVTGDSWYASLNNFKRLRREKLNFLFAVESDRLISNQPKQYQNVSQVEVPEEGLWTHLKNFDFVTLFRTQENEKARHYVYWRKDEQAACRPDFDKGHAEHWNIECFNRVFKQCCNAEHFLVRSKKAVQNHLFCAFVAFAKLEIMVRRQFQQNWYALQYQIEQAIIQNFIQLDILPKLNFTHTVSMN
jgi:hypothetical protein